MSQTIASSVVACEQLLNQPSAETAFGACVALQRVVDGWRSTLRPDDPPRWFQFCCLLQEVAKRLAPGKEDETIGKLMGHWATYGVDLGFPSNEEALAQAGIISA